MPMSTLRNFVDLLQNWDMIEVQIRDRGIPTIFKVKNWERWQNEDNIKDNFQAQKRTKSGQSKDILKNDKNDKNLTTTLPSTAGAGRTGGEGVVGLPGGLEPDPWFSSAENVLGMTEYELIALDRPEYTGIWLDEVYKQTCQQVLSGELTVKNPRKFIEGRVLSIYNSRS